MRNLIRWFKKDTSKKAEKKPVSFSHFSKQQQNEILRKGAENFTRKFSKTFERLAQE
jgi:hypothetical protein